MALTFDGRYFSDDKLLIWTCPMETAKMMQMPSDDIVDADKEHLDVVISDNDVSVVFGYDYLDDLEIKAPVNVGKFFSEMNKYLSSTTFGAMFMANVYYHDYQLTTTDHRDGKVITIIKPRFW